MQLLSSLKAVKPHTHTAAVRYSVCIMCLIPYFSLTSCSAANRPVQFSDWSGATNPASLIWADVLG